MQESVVSQHTSTEDVWSDIGTIATFDEGEPAEERAAAIGSVDNKSVEFKDIKCFSPTSLLVESLIEQLCRLTETDPRDQKNLYNVICHKLHKMNLIDETYVVEEFEFIRSHYQKALLTLLHVAKSTALGESSDKKSALLKWPRKNILLKNNLIYEELPLEWSRYHTEFEELEYIAKGGFGRVFKVRNKLDGSDYAIKKIFLRYRNVNSFLYSLREVKLLAKLNHPNIVSYKAAWLEPIEHILDQGNSKSNISEESKKVILNSILADDSCGVTFGDSSSGDPVSTDFSDKTSGTFSRTFRKSKKKEDCAYFKQMEDKASQSASGISSDEKVICQYNWTDQKSINNFSVTVKQDWAILYIQMQLCHCTLRQWLDERNSRPTPINIRGCINIFHQIVSGVEYIHSQGIVHHDIKPSNIFVNSDMTQIKVGDFGLACVFQHSSQEVTMMAQPSHHFEHKGGQLGTKLYAALEQLQGSCNPKSDVYSLGIILFELIQPFFTDMERSIMITQLKDGDIPKNLYLLCPKVVDLLKSLLSTSHHNRPTATSLRKTLELLSLETLDLDSSSEAVKQLLQVISQQDQQIAELKQKLEVYESRFGND